MIELLNNDFRFSSDMSDQPSQSRARQGHAAGSWRKAWPGDMDEYRAAAAGNTGAGVVVDLHDKIVEIIVAPQTIG
jgi:hypothetical protein